VGRKLAHEAVQSGLAASELAPVEVSLERREVGSEALMVLGEAYELRLELGLETVQRREVQVVLEGSA
jgi:hypothetical protein